jgi:D-alanyl-D-alanine carboxypeptidase/D-alanyl-D-alanine-endopeptidase (penicillin-binding protein 4)
MRRGFDRNNVITVEGEMPMRGRTRVDNVTVHAPHLYFLSLLADRLRSRAVTISATLVDTAGPAAFPVAELSHGIDTVVVYLNKVSDNLSAENLLRTMAAERTGRPGRAEAGHVLVNRFLQSAGVDTGRLVLSDGSGLSRYNLVSASSLIALLRAMRSDPELFPLFRRSLPVAGVDGTINRRMQGTRAQANLRAKTGTLSDVTALSGYVTTADGEDLAFSVIMQKYPWSSRAYRGVQDRIGAFLAGLTREDYAFVRPHTLDKETKKAGE